MISTTQPVAQLLVDMPAESAARLLTLSLLEQLSMHAVSPHTAAASANGVADDASARRLDLYRTGLNRLRGCMALYKDVLGDSVSAKVRRRLRSVTNAANDLHDTDGTMAWLASADVSPQAALTAAWLRDRLTRSRAKLADRLAELRDNPKPFRRLAKRLSVYTTAVRLDDVNASVSFAELTGSRLIAVGERLRAAVLGTHNGDGARTLRRVEREAEHLVYLLEPVGSRENVEQVTGEARELRSDIGRLRAVTLVADVLMQGARRIGARQAMARTHHTIWPATAAADDSAAGRGVHDAVPNELGLGLATLAERLGEESAQAFDRFTARWLGGQVEVLLYEASGIAMALRDR